MLLVDIYKKKHPDDTNIEDRICRFFKDTDSDSEIESLTQLQFQEIKNSVGDDLLNSLMVGTELTINDRIQLKLKDFC